MALVSAKCTQCGGILEVDNSKEAAICPYCQSAYIVEKAVYNYSQSVTIQNANIDLSELDMDQVGYNFEKGRIKAQKEEIEKQREQELIRRKNEEMAAKSES